MKKTIWLSLALGAVLLSVSACSFKKNEVEQTENKQEAVEQTVLNSAIKEICGSEPTVLSNLKVGDFYKTYKIEEINVPDSGCEETPCAAIGARIIFAGEETISGTLVADLGVSELSFIPDDKTLIPAIYAEKVNQSDNAVEEFILKGLSCVSKIDQNSSSDMAIVLYSESFYSKWPGIKDFLSKAKSGDKYSKKVTVTIKDLETFLSTGGESGTKATLVDVSIISQGDLKTYSNKDLGISFNYPKEWPEPVFVKNAGTDGSILDATGQWEIELGDLHKNSLEGADKYFASVRGFYTQSPGDILEKIKSEEKSHNATLIKENEHYIVYTEVGIVGVKNIFVFGDNKVIKIQSLGDTLDSEIDSIAESVIFN